MLHNVNVISYCDSIMIYIKNSTWTLDNIIHHAVRTPSCKLFIVQKCLLYNNDYDNFGKYWIQWLHWLFSASDQVSGGKQALALDPLMHGNQSIRWENCACVALAIIISGKE